MTPPEGTATPNETPAARILVVDDDEQVRTLLVRLLGDHGHLAEAASDAVSARARLDAEEFELALVDIRMPGMSGLALATAILQAGTDTAVVMVTGMDDPSIARTALDEGVYGYVVKPFEASEILISVQGALHRRALEIDARQAQEQSERAYQLERDAAAQLRALDEMKNELMAITAHELRSPTTVIAGFASTLVERFDELSNEEKLDSAVRILANCKRLVALLDNILEVARLDSGEVGYDIRPFDVGELLRRAATELGGAGQGRIRVRLPEDSTPALGDEVRQWEILVNLVSNAIKYSADGQPVDIEARHSGHEWEISVRDHGIGIRQEDVSRLFQKFSRIATPGGPRPKGTGLGLYICKTMVEAQGGRIKLETAPGEGSVFSYTIPSTHIALLA